METLWLQVIPFQFEEEFKQETTDLLLSSDDAPTKNKALENSHIIFFLLSFFSNKENLPSLEIYSEDLSS